MKQYEKFRKHHDVVISRSAFLDQKRICGSSLACDDCVLREDAASCLFSHEKLEKIKEIYPEDFV